MKKILLFAAVLSAILFAGYFNSASAQTSSISNKDLVKKSSSTGLKSEVNMDKYITIDVLAGEDILLNLRAENDNTPIKIVSGDYENTFYVDMFWLGRHSYITAANTMTIYGDLDGFDCSSNRTKINGVDPTHNHSLKSFDCSFNSITSLDLSQNTLLQYCWLSNNSLSNITLADAYPYLNKIAIGSNLFSNEQINQIYCVLPENDITYNEDFILVYDDIEDNMYNAFLATNKSIATDKNWRVLCGSNLAETPPTTGDYVCVSGLNDISDNDINIYPNPAKDEIVLTNVFNEIVKIFDVNGRLVKQEIVNQRMNISDLQSGVYYLQIGNTTKKIIVK